MATPPRIGPSDDTIPHAASRKATRRNLTPAERVAAKATILARLADGWSLQPAAATALDGLHIGGPQVWRWRTVDPAFAADYARAWAAGSEGRAVTASKRGRENAACRGRARAAPAVAPQPQRPRRPRRARPPRRSWEPEEDAVLLRHAGHLAVGEIVARLDALGYGSSRTRRAVENRASLLEVSLAPWACYSAIALAHVLGASHGTVARALRDGLLPSRRACAASRVPHLVARADVERLIRERPWAYNPSALADRGLRALAETIHRADPWWLPPMVAAYLGVSVGRVRVLARSGAVPSRRRVFGAGNGAGGRTVFRRRDVVDYARDQLREGA